ncbi:hypothetical protein CGLO_12888 [Colletotrichum gloeosporioides Cg-14]|uniref:Uncharacterized protein n=1 Tax=Colletotrichum gloeosporioides (strain Cg-14) TaxID=1237896 RepID=T0L8F8_COLGC|nr:hypothetical protein CGLO_12888 [Colletotrichum gloeosporioides Cg-14]
MPAQKPKVAGLDGRRVPHLHGCHGTGCN